MGHRGGTARRGPLKRVTIQTRLGLLRYKHDSVMEILECGHIQLPVYDFYGATGPDRRRCKTCYKIKNGENGDIV